MDALDSTKADNQVPDSVSATQPEAQPSASFISDLVKRALLQCYFDHLASHGQQSLPPLRDEDQAWLQREMEHGWCPRNLGAFPAPLRIDPEQRGPPPAAVDPDFLPSAEVCRANARAAAVRAIKCQIKEHADLGHGEIFLMAQHRWVMPLSADELPSGFKQTETSSGEWIISWQ